MYGGMIGMKKHAGLTANYVRLFGLNPIYWVGFGLIAEPPKI